MLDHLNCCTIISKYNSLRQLLTTADKRKCYIFRTIKPARKDAVAIYHLELNQTNSASISLIHDVWLVCFLVLKDKKVMVDVVQSKDGLL